jgi:hypothetical protein
MWVVYNGFVIGISGTLHPADSWSHVLTNASSRNLDDPDFRAGRYTHTEKNMSMYPDGFEFVKSCSTLDRVCNLTFDFTGATHEMVAAEAVRSLVIKLQSKIRTNIRKNGENPSDCTVNVAETFRTGTIVKKATKKSTVAFLDDMDVAERVEFLKRYNA